jgi:hypothetical protein
MTVILTAFGGTYAPSSSKFKPKKSFGYSLTEICGGHLVEGWADMMVHSVVM